MPGDNFTQELRDAGPAVSLGAKKVWDVNLAVGGPIKRDKLWFYATTRTQGSYVRIGHVFQQERRRSQRHGPTGRT